MTDINFPGDCPHFDDPWPPMTSQSGGAKTAPIYNVTATAYKIGGTPSHVTFALRHNLASQF